MDIPFTITDYVRPACLPQNFEYKPENGAACVASGFGQQGTCDDNEILYATRLKSVVLEIVDNEICAEIHEEHSGEKVVNSQLCAAGFQNGMDTCKGDSGGPLVCDVDGRWTLTGVVSFGLFFGEKDIPGVYTRVTEYLDWIWKNSDLEAHRKTPVSLYCQKHVNNNEKTIFYRSLRMSGMSFGTIVLVKIPFTTLDVSMAGLDVITVSRIAEFATLMSR